MREPSLLVRLGRYGAVGVTAALVHTTALLSLERIAPVWLANPLAFLAASIAGYIGHALVTFREETGGRRFARRWLLLQYAVNLAVCALLPLLLGNWIPMTLRTAVLVFTPTLLNALIWSRAARFSQRLQRSNGVPARIHADDLGLDDNINAAILALARDGQVDGASLLVHGPAAQAGADAWRQRSDAMPLCLHLCLTEGPSTQGCPDLPAGFGTLLLASLLPGRQRRLRPQLDRAIRDQIQRFRLITNQQVIPVDGHQHIHLVPIVLESLLDLADDAGVTWIRTTREPLPTGLPLADWWNAVRRGGLIKWAVLQLLSGIAARRLKQAGIATNTWFSGVLFTGEMTGDKLDACLDALKSRGEQEGPTNNLLLAHPAGPLREGELTRHGFDLSESFFSSFDRQKEWQSLRSRARHG